MNKKNPAVTILFPVFNGLSDTLKFLKSASKINYPGKIEIILINNASTDKTAVKIPKLFPRVKIINNSRNLGFSKAINIGVKKASGELLFITNNDVVLDKNCLSILVDTLLQSDNYGVVGSKVLGLKNKVVKYSGTRFNFWLGTLHKMRNPKKIADTDWVPGCCLLIKKKLFQKFNGFDEGFFFSFEDFDLCLRLKRKGYRIIYQPNAKIYHVESKTIDQFGDDQKAEELYKAKYRFVIKNLNIFQGLSILLFQLILILPYRRLLSKKPYFKTSPLFRGLWWNFLNLSSTLKARKYRNN